MTDGKREGRERRLSEQLERTRDLLRQKERELELRKTLARTLVHDLKNPLSVVLGNLDLLKLSAGERTQRLVERCHAAALRMKGMVADLLDVESLETGTLAVAPSTVDLAEVAREALDEARTTYREYPVTLMSELPKMPCEVLCDPAMIRRAVGSLIANGVARSTEQGRVRLRICARDGGFEIEVADGGAAVPEQSREVVFDKYAKSGLREAGIRVNRGLSLTFARLVAESHGGRVRVEDVPEGRTAFQVWLPAVDREERRKIAGAGGRR